jgi:hypothetical protein
MEVGHDCGSIHGCGLRKKRQGLERQKNKLGGYNLEILLFKNNNNKKKSYLKIK